MRITICQIYYNEDTRKNLDEAFVPFDNGDALDEFFENSAIVRMIESGLHIGSDYFGVLSWNIKVKAKEISNGLYSNGTNLIDTIRENSQYDVFAINHDRANHNPILNPAGHPYMLEIADLVFQKFGKFNIRNIHCSSSIYMNHFVARSNVYEAYVKTWLIPIMSIMRDSANKELQNFLWRDSLYKSHEKNPERAARFIKQFGVKHFTMHAFFCERMFSIWLAVLPKKLKICYL